MTTSGRHASSTTCGARTVDGRRCQHRRSATGRCQAGHIHPAPTARSAPIFSSTNRASIDPMRPPAPVLDRDELVAVWHDLRRERRAVHQAERHLRHDLALRSRDYTIDRVVHDSDGTSHVTVTVTRPPSERRPVTVTIPPGPSPVVSVSHGVRQPQ